MNKICIIILICSVCQIHLLAQNNPQDPLPKIEFEKKRHEFKDIVEDTFVECYFKFKNTGNAPLQFLKVKTSCGCASPFWPRKPIQPGDSSSIKVVFNPKGYARKNFAKAIIITTNIPNKAKNSETTRYVLSITGNVLHKDDLIPQDTTIKLSTYSIKFGEIKKGKKVKLKLEITNTGSDTLIIKEIQKSSDIIEITNEFVPILPQEKLILKIEIDTETYDKEIFAGIIRIITNIPVKQTKRLSNEGIIITGRVIQKN